MSGNSDLAWLALISGMLLQLTYMIVPFRRWDWARYLGCAALTALVFVSEKRDHPAISAGDGLVLCGAFTFAFALAFQNRLLPRLNEGVVLIWTTVLICVTVELNAWQSAKTYLVLGAGLPACALVIVRHKLPYALKIALYAWFLIAVVAMGVLQFRGSDLSLIASGGSDRLDYGFALIDGAAAAYIGVHVVFLYEILPIPAKGERWSEFQARWTEYLNEIVARLDDLHLDARVALSLVLGIALVAYANHELGLMPDRVLANLLLFGLPAASAVIFSDGVTAPPGASAESPGDSGSGIGRARHSRKHRRTPESPGPPPA